MKRSTKKAFGLALSGVLGSGSFLSSVSAATYTWQTTVGSQDWLTAANWLSGSMNAVPGQNDTALFNVNIPPSNTVNLSGNASVGAILDDLTGNLTVSGTSTLTLYGQTLTVPQSGVSLTNEANVILAMGSSSAETNTLTIGDTLALENAQNVIVAGANVGLSNTGQTIDLTGNILNATATPAQLTILGGGTPSNFGATFNLNGSNSAANYFTGGMVIGNTAGTEGAEVSVTPTSIPTSGTIVVNEQSQLLLNGVGTYGAGTTLDLNGGGIGPGVSQGSSGALRTKGTGSFTYAGTVNIGTDTTGSAALGYVVISSTGTNTVTFSGAVTGSGNIQKQGGGYLILSGSGNTWNGGLQIGNGAVTAASNSAIGTGDLTFAQTSTNSPIVNLFNAAQTVGNLSSSFALTSGTDTQTLSLNGTALTINATANNVFGDGAVSTLTSSIVDGMGTHGSVIYHGATGAQLSLTGANTYSGGTTVTGGILDLANVSSGSATGTGNVTVSSGGTLTSGGGVTQFQAPVSAGNPIVTSGSMSGGLIVNSGGIVSPGGAPGSGLIGSLSVGSITAHTGSIFDFALAGSFSSDFSSIASAGAATLDNGGTETVNVSGSTIAVGSYELMSFGASLTNAGTAFTLGTTPNGANRTYSLSTTNAGVFLNITDTGDDRFWTVGGGNSPLVDGGGNWANGSTNFYNSNPSTTQAAYNSSAALDLVFGDSSHGNGGTVTLTGSVGVVGTLIFSPVTTPYVIGATGGTNTLTLGSGISSANNATINAPIVLSGSQTFSTATGTTLNLNGGISGGAALTLGDAGTVVLAGTNTYSGGTVINNGTLQTSTSSLPTTGGVNINNSNSSLVFVQAGSGAAYGGLISGSGSVTVNSSAAATITLSNPSNSYNGSTNIQSGVLSASSAGALGTGAGGINFSGGTLQFTAPLTFPEGSPAQSIDLVSGTSMVDTDGNNVTLGQDLEGAGNLTKIGGGNLTLTGLIPTTIIGQLGVTGGSLTLNGSASFGFSAASGGTFTGDLILAGSLEARLYGGTFSGGGNIRIPSSGVNVVSYGAVTIDNPIVLNENNNANFIANIGAKAGDTLAINSAISGNSDVDFTGGAGVVNLYSQSTYTGATTIDNGAAGEIQLDVNNALPTTTDVHLTANATLDLFGNVTQTMGSLDSGGGLLPMATGSTNAIVTNNSPDPTTLVTVIVNGSLTTNFAGFITDNANTPTPGGKLAIELGSAYTGTLVLNSPTYNQYSGGTILNGGTLLLGSQGDALLGSAPGVGVTAVSGVTFGGGTLELSSNWSTSRPLTINPGVSTVSEYTPGQSFNITAPSLSWNGGTLSVTNTGASTITQTSGPISVTAGSKLSVGAGSAVTVNGSVDPFTDSSSSTSHVGIVNNGAFTVAQVNSSIAGITGTGTLTVGDGSTANTLQLATSNNSLGSSQDSLSIVGNSTLDITNNILYIDYGGGQDPISSIAAWIKSGYLGSGGKWTGDGITSSTAKNNSGSYGIGYADSSDSGNPAHLASGQIEIKYTLLGDANLDGKVNGTDFTILATNFNQSVTDGWDKGDFNYDGKVNGTDFLALAGNFNQSAGQTAVAGDDLAAVETFAAANGISLSGLNLTSVPEPASMGLLTLGAVGALARRRRRE